MSKTILRATNNRAVIKVGEAAATVNLAIDIKGPTESLLYNAAKVITIATWAANAVTITIVGHGYATGDMITITGMTPAAYNGVYSITRLTANTFSYPLAVDPTVSTVLGLSASYFITPAASIYRVMCTGNFNLSRNGSTVISNVSGNPYDFDFSQMECVDFTDMTHDIVITPASAGVQVYVILRKETGYVEQAQPELYGAYDNPTSVLA